MRERETDFSAVEVLRFAVEKADELAQSPVESLLRLDLVEKEHNIL